MSLSWLRAVTGVAGSQLRHQRRRVTLAVVGVALAVLLTVLLAALGNSVLTVGHRGITALDVNLWLTGGPVEFAPGSVGAVENSIVNAHEVARDVNRRPAVTSASALAFRTVYVSDTRHDFETVVGVGVASYGQESVVNVREGSGFSSGDVHYANGTYDGPMTHEVVVDARTAAMFDVGVGDHLYVGGTIHRARTNRFQIVGISSNIERFLGAPTATLHLSELQEVSAATGTDRAAVIPIGVEASADPAAVARAIEDDHPRYEVRTTDQQFRAVLQRQSLLVASALTLVLLAVVAGATLVVNVLATYVLAQRAQLAALKAGGVSGRTLVAVVAGQGLVVGLLGGVVGLAIAYPAVAALNGVVTAVVGFENLVSLTVPILAGGATLALVVGLFGALVAGRQVAKLGPLAHLE